MRWGHMKDLEIGMLTSQLTQNNASRNSCMFIGKLLTSAGLFAVKISFFCQLKEDN